MATTRGPLGLNCARSPQASSMIARLPKAQYSAPPIAAPRARRRPSPGVRGRPRKFDRTATAPRCRRYGVPWPPRAASCSDNSRETRPGSRSAATCTISPLRIAPRPSAPSAQCSTVPPGKWPPSRSNVTPCAISSASPSQWRIAGSGRMTQSASATCRWTGQSKARAQSCMQV